MIAVLRAYPECGRSPGDTKHWMSWWGNEDKSRGTALQVQRLTYLRCDPDSRAWFPHPPESGHPTVLLFS